MSSFRKKGSNETIVFCFLLSKEELSGRLTGRRDASTSWTAQVLGQAQWISGAPASQSPEEREVLDHRPESWELGPLGPACRFSLAGAAPFQTCWDSGALTWGSGKLVLSSLLLTLFSLVLLRLLLLLPEAGFRSSREQSVSMPDSASWVSILLLWFESVS